MLFRSYIGLLDVFKIPAIARRTRARSTAPSSRSFSQEFVFPLRPDRRRAHLTPSTVVTFDAFLRNWEVFTHNILSKMKPSDWSNIIVAGGSVLASLITQPSRPTLAEKLNMVFLGEAWGTSDIDIFLWGLSPDQVFINNHGSFITVG